MRHRLKSANSIATIIPRNPVARSPLMHKGGVHEKSKTVRRQQANNTMQEELQDWREAVQFELEIRDSLQGE